MMGRIWEANLEQGIPDSIYKYRVMSVEHLQELQDDFRTIDSQGQVSNNPVFRSYIQQQQHHLPATFPEARSVIVMAVFTPLMIAEFQYGGVTHEVLVPHYYDDGISEEHLKTTIWNRIICDNQYRLENAKMHVLLKRLAVRTGLGKYGRNNICYVEGMGSFLKLFAFFTDFKFNRDDWQDPELMVSCKNCKICLKECPTGAISEDNFVIDVERCIPLYNEVPGEFPRWINPTSHNALMGCLRCQLPCPANNQVINMTQKLGSVTEEETKHILRGTTEEDLIQSLSEKIRMFIPEHAYYFYPVISRNLKALLLNE